MPNRIIKESIRTSDKINQLTDFQYRLWSTLLVYVDDYGRGDGRPAVIKGYCFPLRDQVTSQDIAQGLRELQAAGCIRLYEVDGRPYLLFPTWEEHQRVRQKISKYPAPEDEQAAGEMCDEPAQAKAGSKTCAINGQQTAAKMSDGEGASANETPDAATCGESRRPAAKGGLNPNPNPNPYPNPNPNPDPDPDLVLCKDVGQGEPPACVEEQCPELLASEASGPEADAIHIRLQNGQDLSLPQGAVELYRRRFPAVDVERALRALEDWCRKNPRSFKTWEIADRFICAWINTAGARAP